MKEKDRLILFLERVNELKENKLIREGYESGFKVKWTAESGVLDFEFTQPEEVHFRSLLIDLRQFLLKKEPIYVSRIYNICKRAIRKPQHIEFIEKSRRYFDESIKSSAIRLNFDGKQFTPDIIWDEFINGVYFHNDSEKRESIKRLLPHEQNIVKNELYGFVNACIKHITYLGKIIEHSFSHDDFEF